MENKKAVYNEIVFTEEQVKDIITAYQNGESSVSIGKRYGITHKPILKVLHQNGIVVDSSRSKRKYGLEESYFDCIDTPSKAYIFGLLCADGSICRKKDTVSICLEEGDYYILEQIRQELKSEKELEFIDNSEKKDYGYNYKNQFRLVVFSSYMCDALISKGMVENKSWNLEYPDCINDLLLKHFVRGYFDGNGSYCPHITKKGKFQPLITITSTNNFCKGLRDKLKETLNIPCGNVYDASCHNGTTKVLSFSGANQVKRFLDWMYEDAEMYLVRKYEKYTNSFKNINNSVSA